MYKATVDQLLDFLRDELGDSYTYYNGDPDLIPNFNLPAIVVIKFSDQNSNGPTGMRRVEEQLQIKVIFDKADDWTSQGEQTELTEKKIRDLVEARDPDTGAYLTNTLKHAITHRFTSAGLALDDNITFELGAVERPGDIVTEEGHLTLSLSYLIPNIQA